MVVLLLTFGEAGIGTDGLAYFVDYFLLPAKQKLIIFLIALWAYTEYEA